MSLLDTIIPIPSDLPLHSQRFPSFYFLELVHDFFISKCKSKSYFAGLDSKYDSLCAVKDYLQYEFTKFYSLSCDTDVSDFNFLYSIDSFSIFDSAIAEHLLSCPLVSDFISFVYNRVRPSYRLSVGLGSNGLDYVSDDFKLDVSSFLCFDSKYLNLPSYYFRKLFYRSVRHLDKYVSVKTELFTRYKHICFSSEKFRSLCNSFACNFSSFRASLPPELSLSLDLIPHDVFCAFYGLRNLSFKVDDLPEISLSDPWSYIRKLDFSYDGSCLHSRPLGLDDFVSDGFLSFRLHPLFVSYPSIYRLCCLYSSFTRSVSCKVKVSDTLNYFNHNISSYAVYTPFSV